MLDVVFIGATVLFFIVVAAIASGSDRLGRRDGDEPDALTPDSTVPSAESVTAESRVQS